MTLIILFNTIFTHNTIVKNVNIELEFNEENAFIYVKNQTNDIGLRIPGTDQHKQCLSFFISKFKEINSSFTYSFHNFTVLGINCSNLLFKMNEEKENIVILGAHFDSRKRATKDPVNTSAPVPGANDGASGCAVLLELARVLYNKRDNLSCQIWFLFFDAEDQGRDLDFGIPDWEWCEGSERFVNNIEDYYDTSEERFECMVLLDMVGGVNLKFIKETHSTSLLLDEIFKVGRQLGYTNAFPESPESNSIKDDHVYFVEYGIPSADLIINFWNNPSWPYHHTTEDNLSNISNYSLQITGRTVEQFIYNKFLNESNFEYQGNYPWNLDNIFIDYNLYFQISFLVILIICPILIYIITLAKDKAKLNNL